MRCGYCQKDLVATAVVYPGARPSCGSAQCLIRALRDSDKEKEG